MIPTRSNSNVNPQLHQPLRHLLHGFGALLLGFGGTVNAAPPNLTTGGVPNNAEYINLGPTGMEGWIYNSGGGNFGETAEARQIKVTKVDAGSPADGILAVNDVILGASGTGVNPVAFTSDARKALAYAINDAEGRNPAVLKLIRWRAGVTTTVSITLEYLGGSYTATAPYNCPKSAAILEKGVNYIMSGEPGAGYGGFGTTVLMAVNDPSNPANAARQARAQTEARALNLTQAQIDDMTSGDLDRAVAKPWSIGPSLITQAEYYLQTGDSTVLPSIRARAIQIANGQSMFGTMGHHYALEGPNGEINAPYGIGYGPVNNAGMPCFLGLILAKKCGLTDLQITAGIDRAAKYFQFYSDLGTVPYGENKETGSPSNNGKSGLAAITLGLLDGYERQSKYFAKISVYGASERDGGHTGPYFNHLWTPLGANVGGQDAMARYFNQTSWLFDLARKWNGAFVYQAYYHGGIIVYGQDHRASWTTLLTYAAPLAKLHINGKSAKPALALNATDMADINHAIGYNPATRTTAQLVQDLAHPLPQLHWTAGIEIGNNRKADHASILPTLLNMAQNGATFAEQHGALFALSRIADDSTAPVLAGLLMSPDSKVRRTAAQALWSLSLTAKTAQLTNIVNALIATDRPILPLDPQDPMHQDKEAFGGLLFSSSGIWGSGRVTTADRALLYPAFRIIASAPMGGARNHAFGVASYLTKTDVENLAEVLVEVAQEPPPAENNLRGSRTAAISAMESRGFAEGVPLSVITFLEAFNDHAIPLGILEDYAGSSLTVQPDPKVPDLCQSLVKSGDFVPEAQAVLDAIEADQLPYKLPRKLTPFKRIDWVVADKPSLNLPATSTVLRLQATDFANGTPIFTWRKVHGAGSVTFAPNGTGAARNTTVVFDGAPGVYLFEVKMSDSRGFTEVYKTVQVTLRDANGTLPPNAPPTANNQSLATTQGTATQVILTGVDPEGRALNYTVTQNPGNGSLSGTAPHLVYTPAANYTGPDSIIFEVEDSEGQKATATVNITVNTAAPVGLAIYEPFDMPSTAILNGAAGSGSIGFSGSWSAGVSITAVPPSLGYGTLPVRGNRVKSVSTNSPGGSRPISSSALAGRGLLDDGATVWVSMMLQGDGYPNSGRISIALANNGLSYEPNIPNDGTQPGSGLGVTVDDGVVYAAQYYAAAVGPPLLGSHNSAAGDVNYATPRLVVAKITWGATSDHIEVYMPWEDMVLPAQPTSVLTANVNQALFDTLTFSRGHNVLLDELRVGATYQSVVQGTVAMTADTTAPTPDPMSFAVAPVPAGNSSITMTATPAHDLMEVEYYFDCIAGAGGHDSGWQASPVYTDIGLTPGIQYTYQVKARDKHPGLNETTLSAAASATIAPLATVPNVVGILKDPAEDLVEAAGLSVGSITNATAYSLSVPAGHVLTQSQTAGSAAAYGSPVDFVISIGHDPALPTLAPINIVDDKIGGPVVINTPMTYTLTFNEDINSTTLNASDFVNVGTAAVTIGTVTEISPGVVTVVVTPTGPGILRFAVAAGASILDAQGQAFNSTNETIDDTVITIQLPSVSVPNVVGMTQAAATSAITSANLFVGALDSIHSATVAAGSVISQSPAGGSSLPGQNAVDLVLSLGPPPDRIRPLIASVSPIDNATDVAVLTNLVVTFNENIAIGTGNITLKNLTDGTQTIIPVTDGTQVTNPAASAVLTINPSVPLLAEKNYAVRIDATAIKDLSNNSFAGIASDTTWNFRTADITPPAPNPMTFAVLPNAPGETSVTMRATTASDPSGVQYFFECTAGGGSNSAWQDSATFTATGLTAQTGYSYRVRARDKSTAQNVTAWSAVASATTPVPDTIAPTPSPMSFAVLPSATGETSITMTATTATDPSGVQYFFECTAGGGSNSAWQDSPTYTATGLTGNTPYSYRVRARDKSPTQTATDWSAAASATTWSTPRNLFSAAAKAWNTSAANWGTVTGGPYNTATWQSGDNAILEGAVGAVTLGEAISLRNLTFTHTTGTYTITGSALNFPAGGTITPNNPPTNTNGVTIQSNITGSPAINLSPMDGDEQFTLNPAAAGSMIIGTVTGSGGSGSEKLNLQGGAGSSGTIAAVSGAKVIQTAGAWTLNGASFGYGHAISGGTLTLKGNLNATHRSVALSGTGVLNYNVANAVSATAASATSGDNGFRITGGSIDQTSGSAINSSTTNPTMDWAGNWTFIGSNGAASNLHLGNGAVFLKGGNRQITVTNADTTLTVGGMIANDATPGRGLTKAGLGTLRLSGANFYTGATTVTAGKLLISGNQSNATGNVSVAANATLGGTGIIGGNTTIEANGKFEFNISTPPGDHDKLELADGRSLNFSGASSITIAATEGATVGTYTLVTAPGGIISEVLPSLNLPEGWQAEVSISGNDLVLVVTVTDGIAPTLAAMIDDQGGNSVEVNTTVNYTVIFNEDIDVASVGSDDFGNAGTSSVTFGAITETSPGVFSVAVTPTSVGTLCPQVNSGAVITDVVGNALNTTSAIPDDTTITVIPINIAPVWAGNPVNEANATEDAVYSSTLADNASDANGNTLTFSKVSGPAWLSVASNGALSGTPANSNVGPNLFTVSVSDGTAPPVQATLTITVINSNDPPGFAENPIVRATAVDTPYTGTLAEVGFDVDAGAILTYAKVSGPAWLSIAANGALSGTPTSSNLGLNNFTVSVSDGIAPAVQATLNITVVVPGNLYSSGAKTWNNTTANWGTVTAGPYNTSTWSGGNNAIFEGAAGTVTLGEAISLKNLTFTHTTGTYTITGSALNFASGTITASSPPNTSTVNAIIRSNITGSPALNLTPMDGDEQFTLNPLDSGSMSIGTVSGSGGAGSEKLNLQGGAGSSGTIADANGVKVIQTSGAWTLNGDGSFGYGHAISAGNLTLNANLNATQRSVALSGTGVLNYNVAGAVSATAATNVSTDNGFRITGGTLDQTSGAAINTNASTTHIDLGGNLTFAGSNGANSNLHMGSGPVWLKDGNRQITVTNAATTLTIGGVIQNDDTPGRGLTKSGAGTLELRGANTYTGATAINAGTLILRGANNATNAITFGSGGTGVLGLNTGSSVAAASAAVNLTNGTVRVFGPTGAPSYTLLTAASITGTPSLASPVPGYQLQLAAGNTQLRLVQTGSPYTTWASTNALGSGPDEDFDNDGVPNAIEFILGGDKNTKDLAKLPTLTTIGGNMAFTFTRVRDSADPGVSVFIEVGTNLSTWPDAFTVGSNTATSSPEVTVNDNGNGTDTIILTLPQAPHAGRFARLKVGISP